MECERLNRLVRSWYVQVQEEALAPARMVEFMEKHVKGCEVCLGDPDVRSEVRKIIEIVLPPSKMIKPAKDDEEEEEEMDTNTPSPYYSRDEDGDMPHSDDDEEEEEEEDDEEDEAEEDDEEDFIPSMIDDEDDL